MSLRLFDTATREVRDFVPLTPGKVGMYICGLTTQGAPHIGHIRFAVAFDVLRRWLERGHGYDVTLIRNVTDIDDKILVKAAATGTPWYVISYTNERATTAALDALGVLPATYEPRATGHVPEMVQLMDTLVDKGHAYAAADGSGDVYFDVKSWPAYGELSRQALDDMAPAEDADPRGKRDPRDFALWKGRKASEPTTASWPTPYGAGRPGWHLECSAMARKYLGDTFDIHGGAVDLRFPHHENEIAQSRAAGYGFARYWLHNAWLTAAGEKMSKSLGNGALVSEVVQRYPARAVRFYLAQPHYRSAIEFSDTSLDEATAALARIDSFVDRAVEVVGERPESVVPEAFAAAMDDDLGTPGAVAVLYQAVRDGNTALAAGDTAGAQVRLAEVLGMLGVLGLDAADPIWQSAEATDEKQLTAVVDGLVGALLEQRAAARARKDFAAADALRDSLTSLGITVTDTPSGPRWSLG